MTQIAISSIQFMDDFSKPVDNNNKTFKQTNYTNAANIFSRSLFNTGVKQNNNH